MIVLLDIGSLGLVTNPQATGPVLPLATMLFPNRSLEDEDEQPYRT